jgi:hypothetical protein
MVGRIGHLNVVPKEAVRALFGLERSVRQSGLDPLLLGLVRQRLE